MKEELIKLFDSLSKEHQENIIYDMMIFRQSEINEQKKLEKQFGKDKPKVKIKGFGGHNGNNW